MRAAIVIGLCSVLAIVGPANAAWHVEDDAGGILIVGSAEAKSGAAGFITLRCRKDHLIVAVATDYSVQTPDELAEYKDAKLRFRFGDSPERQVLTLPGAVSLSVGKVVTLTAEADKAQSKAIMKSIFRGNRFDAAVEHPLIEIENNQLTVYSPGFVSVINAVADKCPALAE